VSTCASDAHSWVGSCTQPIVAAQIVQATGRFKAEIDILVSPIPKHIARDMEDFRTTNTVVDSYPLPCYRLIGRLFFRGYLALGCFFFG
jgi:hypothetical protein